VSSALPALGRKLFEETRAEMCACVFLFCWRRSATESAGIEGTARRDGGFAAVGLDGGGVMRPKPVVRPVRISKKFMVAIDVGRRAWSGVGRRSQRWKTSYRFLSDLTPCHVVGSMNTYLSGGTLTGWPSTISLGSFLRKREGCRCLLSGQ